MRNPKTILTKMTLTKMTTSQKNAEKKKIIGKVFENRNEKIIPLHRRSIKTDFALRAKKIKFLVHEKFFPS